MLTGASDRQGVGNLKRCLGPCKSASSSALLEPERHVVAGVDGREWCGCTGQRGLVEVFGHGQQALMSGAPQGPVLGPPEHPSLKLEPSEGRKCPQSKCLPGTPDASPQRLPP